MIILAYRESQVIIRSPDWNDNLLLPLRTTIHFAMNGQPWTYKATPVKARRIMNFSSMNRDKILEIDAFIKQSMGHEILLTDHFGVQSKVKITTTPFTAVHQSRQNSTFTLEFEQLYSGPTGD